MEGAGDATQHDARCRRALTRIRQGDWWRRQVAIDVVFVVRLHQHLQAIQAHDVAQAQQREFTHRSGIDVRPAGTAFQQQADAPLRIDAEYRVVAGQPRICHHHPISGCTTDAHFTLVDHHIRVLTIRKIQAHGHSPRIVRHVADQIVMSTNLA
ncbi:MAG: hypothetical protein LKM39_05055 [Chiayiivirga sp.]|jgi:hypothetical protein|nr:hypothetical protein [Chiayiivirga sp.]